MLCDTDVQSFAHFAGRETLRVLRTELQRGFSKEKHRGAREA